MILSRKTLPECTIGKSGVDLFSRRKDLTVIMIPFERFSSFPKAVDDLYRSVDVPFNLIVVEGKAPESVRLALEARQKKHKNITIIYTDQQTSVGRAINLAAPHLTTKYAFLVDNDVRIPHETISKLLRSAKENEYGIVCPKHYLVPAPEPLKLLNRVGHSQHVQDLGIRTCFLISQEAMIKLGKFDENLTPCAAGIDFLMEAERLGISICDEANASMEWESEHFIWPMDVEQHSFQWNESRVYQSFEYLDKKWGIHLREADTSAWFESKKKDLREGQNILLCLSRLFSKRRNPGEDREMAGERELVSVKTTAA